MRKKATKKVTTKKKTLKPTKNIEPDIKANEPEDILSEDGKQLKKLIQLLKDSHELIDTSEKFILFGFKPSGNLQRINRSISLRELLMAREFLGREINHHLDAFDKTCQTNVDLNK